MFCTRADDAKICAVGMRNAKLGNHLNLQKQCVPTGARKRIYQYQASKDSNNLDNDIKNFKSLSFFKAKLKNL